MTENIKIRKPAGKKKDAVRINNVEDIPEFLRGSIDIADDALLLTCVEGDEKAPLGSVIGYEKSEKTQTGWNCWWIANAATNLIEEDGIFYTKATILEAAPVTDELPELMQGANVRHNDDGSWTLFASWGETSGKPGESYWVKSGVDDEGKPTGYFLTKSEESYKSFFVVGDDGEDIGPLSEIDPA